MDEEELDEELIEDDEAESEDEEEVQADEVDPTLTYKLVNGRIRGTCDDLEALKQAVLKILLTERFLYPIYTDDYGNELPELVGQEYDFVLSNVEVMIAEALETDERILDIGDFEYPEQEERNVLVVNFNVTSIYGDFVVESEVVT